MNTDGRLQKKKNEKFLAWLITDTIVKQWPNSQIFENRSDLVPV